MLKVLSGITILYFACYINSFSPSFFISCSKFRSLWNPWTSKQSRRNFLLKTRKNSNSRWICVHENLFCSKQKRIQPTHSLLFRQLRARTVVNHNKFEQYSPWTLCLHKFQRKLIGNLKAKSFEWVSQWANKDFDWRVLRWCYFQKFFKSFKQWSILRWRSNRDWSQWMPK